MTTPRWLSILIAAWVLVAWLAVVVDGAYRSGWDGVSRPSHYAAALFLYTAAGAFVGVLGGALFWGYRAIGRRVSARKPSLSRWLAPLSGALIGAVPASTTAFWLFSGQRVRGTALATWGPWVLMLVAAGAAAAGAEVIARVARRAESGRSRAALTLAVVLFLVAAVLARIDLTFYVSLYSRLHTFLEVTAGSAAAFGFVLVMLVVAARSSRGFRVVEWVAYAGAATLVTFVLVEPSRAWASDALRHAWREPVYVGRMLSRVQIAEAFVRDPRGWRGATMSNVVRLRERYDIATTTRSPVWDKPLEEPPWFKEKLANLRGTKEYNIVVFYVDTLRDDVARDPRIMPNLARFASRSIDFRRAYTTGSDTLHALPGMTGGSYDLFARQPNDVLHVARSAGYHSVLFVAQSAHEFLAKMLPEFTFEETKEVPDYAPGNENVWGYGADQPTAARLVDRALDWLRERREKRFLLWMFNFDVHNWRELDDAYVREIGKREKLLDTSDPIYRYRIVARSIDVQFQRFLDGLRDLGMADDTIVLFVSDHGEGLGRDGFWVHSVFLWEGLVRVPLVLHVPGIEPKVVPDLVSIVDIAPTLARFMAKDAETSGYHGEDLLGYLVPGRPKRHLPIVLMSTLKEVPVRLGIIDPEAPWKLVLSLEGAVPELYDLRAEDPDALDVSEQHEPEMLRLLNDLVRAPAFPRLSEAGNGSLDQAAKEGRDAAQSEAAAKGR